MDVVSLISPIFYEITLRVDFQIVLLSQDSYLIKNCIFIVLNSWHGAFYSCCFTCVSVAVLLLFFPVMQAMVGEI